MPDAMSEYMSNRISVGGDHLKNAFLSLERLRSRNPIGGLHQMEPSTAWAATEKDS